MKRKLISFSFITLICVMLITSVIPGNCESSDSQGDVGTTGIPVTINTLLGVPSYTVTIPSEIKLTNVTQTAESNIAYQDFNITVSKVLLLNDNHIEVILTGSGESDAFTLAAEGDTIAYDIKTGTGYTESVVPGNSFISVDAEGAEIPCRLSVDTSQIKKEDTYTGTLNFTFMTKSNTGS